MQSGVQVECLSFANLALQCSPYGIRQVWWHYASNERHSLVRLPSIQVTTNVLTPEYAVNPPGHAVGGGPELHCRTRVPENI